MYLTEREQQILDLLTERLEARDERLGEMVPLASSPQPLASCLTNRQIAHYLGISVIAAADHVASVCRKLEAIDRVSAAAAWQRLHHEVTR